MRPTVWVNCLAIVLLTAASGCADAHGRHTPAPPAVPGALPSWTVESGWATTREDAVQEALERAQAKVVEYLRAQNPPVEWTPPRDFIRSKLWTKDLEADDDTFRALG